MTPGKKLAIVVALQFLVLLSVLGFKQYTVRTANTVVLRVQTVDPRDLLRRDDVMVEYEISRIDPATIAWDDPGYCCGMTVYIELQRQDDGLWQAIAANDRRTHTRDGTELIRGTVHGAQYEYPEATRTMFIRYGIEDIFVPESSASQLPAGRDHIIAVELKVDRFGNATPRRFLIDGERFDLRRR